MLKSAFVLAAGVAAVERDGEEKKSSFIEASAGKPSLLNVRLVPTVGAGAPVLGNTPVVDDRVPIDYTAAYSFTDGNSQAFNCNNQGNTQSDSNCYDARSAQTTETEVTVPGNCSWQRNEDGDILEGTDCGGSPLNNLWTNCTIVILPTANEIQNFPGDPSLLDQGGGLVLNPFWCFDPTICQDVMQQGFMTGSRNTNQNSYCCTSIFNACKGGIHELWHDYWCTDRVSRREKCANIGTDGDWANNDPAGAQEELNKKCQDSIPFVNDCCCGQSACFGGDSTVTLQNGQEARLGDIKVGDVIETPAGFEAVTGFMHETEKDPRRLLSVKHEHGAFNVTTGHLVFLADGESILAGDLEIGSVLASPSGESKVQHIAPVTVSEYYGPLTNSGTVTIGGVHASVYADIKSHSLMHFGLSPLRTAQQIFTSLMTQTTPRNAPAVCPTIVS
eukprot:gene239-323_t